MKRKRICLFILILLAFISYCGGYLYVIWHLEDEQINDIRTLPVTAGKENFILPETKLVEHIVDLKTGEILVTEKPMPAIYLGLEREELVKWFDDYMSNLPISEREQGLVSCNVESYSVQEVIIKKQYYASEDYHQFFMIYKNGRIVVYHSDQKTVYDYPDIYLYDLPLDIQCQIIMGLEIKDEVELYNFLQNYSS